MSGSFTDLGQPDELSTGESIFVYGGPERMCALYNAPSLVIWIERDIQIGCWVWTVIGIECS
jgi:hypothetical protein